jgi:hypothetical protein
MAGIQEDHGLFLGDDNSLLMEQALNRKPKDATKAAANLQEESDL